MNILKIKFDLNVARMEYLQRYLIALLGILVGGGFAMVGVEAFTNELAQAIFVIIGVSFIGYFYIYALAALVARFRNCGVEKTATMFATVIAYSVGQTLFAPIAIIPFVWSPKKVETDLVAA